jgi:hypothetical protein
VTVELLVDGAELVATLDAEDREISGGRVAPDRGLVVAVGGRADPRPAAALVLPADGCLVTPGAVSDLVCRPLTGIPFAGALKDPVEAWLRCGPVAARHMLVAGRAVGEDAQLVHPGLEEMLRRHSVAARRIRLSA